MCHEDIPFMLRADTSASAALIWPAPDAADRTITDVSEWCLVIQKPFS
jgi:hypothetical protein